MQNSMREEIGRQRTVAHLQSIQPQCVSAPELGPGLLLAQLQQAGDAPEPECHQDLAVQQLGPIGSRVVPLLTGAGCRLAGSRGTRPHLCDGALRKSQLPREVAAEEAAATRQSSHLGEDLENRPSVLPPRLVLPACFRTLDSSTPSSMKEQGSKTTLEKPHAATLEKEERLIESLLERLKKAD